MPSPLYPANKYTPSHDLTFFTYTPFHPLSISLTPLPPPYHRFSHPLQSPYHRYSYTLPYPYHRYSQYTLKLKGVSYACDAMLDVDYGSTSGETDDSALDAAMSYLNNQLTASEKGSMAGGGEYGGGSPTGAISRAGIRDLLSMNNNNGAKADGSTNTPSRSQDHFTLPELNLAELAVKQTDDEVVPPMTSSYTILLRSRVAHPLKFKLATEAEAAGLNLSFAPSIGHLGNSPSSMMNIYYTSKKYENSILLLIVYHLYFVALF